MSIGIRDAFFIVEKGIFKFNKKCFPNFSACIRFFAYLSSADTDSLTKFPEFTADVFDSVYRFDAFDVTRRQLAFETLAVIGSSSEAKQILSQNESLFSMQRAMSHLAVAIATASEPSLKARHLEAVRMIFDQIAVAGSAQKQNFHRFARRPFRRQFRRRRVATETCARLSRGRRRLAVGQCGPNGVAPGLPREGTVLADTANGSCDRRGRIECGGRRQNMRDNRLIIYHL
uniref:Uncharacterized protein n=1 Tax=Globodera rostochiensis TaxID=31243 RepID=A0A914H4B5_GLORO